MIRFAITIPGPACALLADVVFHQLGVGEVAGELFDARTNYLGQQPRCKLLEPLPTRLQLRHETVQFVVLPFRLVPGRRNSSFNLLQKTRPIAGNLQSTRISQPSLDAAIVEILRADGLLAPVTLAVSQQRVRAPRIHRREVQVIHVMTAPWRT